MDTYDVVVLGAGAVGENVADRAVRGGLSAALIESNLVGGECSYWACMPSKALLRGPEVLAQARAVHGAAEAVTGSLSVPATMSRRDEFTHHWEDKSQVDWATSKGIDVLRGRGRLIGERTVAVVDADGIEQTVSARHAVVVATGSSASIPPIPGLREARPWTSREATSTHLVPRRLGIIGGGVVGVEMATAWNAFGSKITLFEVADRLLATHEPFVGERMVEVLREGGVIVHTGANVSEVRRTGEGPTTVMLGDEEIEVDTLLVATGRRPNTADIGLDRVGLKPGSWLRADRHTHVAGGWLYAVGDVAGRELLTHMGKYEARVCGDVIVARVRGEELTAERFTVREGVTPSVIFTDPQVASVGLTEYAGREAGLAVRVVSYKIGDVSGAAVRADGYRGTAQLVLDESRQVVVGATFVGPEVGELLHAATIAIVGEVPLERLWHAVPSYPTVSEVWLRLLETAGL